MYIRELREDYPLLFEELVKYSRAYSREQIIEQQDMETVSSVAIWSTTPQGGTFWSDIHSNRLDRIAIYKEKFPELFTDEKKIDGVTIKSNGLFKVN